MTFWKGQGIHPVGAGFAGVLAAGILMAYTEMWGPSLAAGTLLAAGLNWYLLKAEKRKNPAAVDIAFFIPAWLWTWIYLGLVVPSLAMGAMALHTRWEESRMPGYAAFEAADDKIDSLKQGKAHGNSLLAEAAANRFAQTIYMNRLKPGKQLAEPENKGEYLTYCHEAKDSIVFLIHVPEIMEFLSEPERDRLIGDVWTFASIQARSVDLEGKKTLIMGLRGPENGDYISIIRGKPKLSPLKFNGKRKAEILFPPFAENQAVPAKTES